MRKGDELKKYFELIEYLKQIDEFHEWVEGPHQNADDYVKKLANNIEKKLNMNSDDIKALSRTEFKRLLRNGYFTEKRYHGSQTEHPFVFQFVLFVYHDIFFK
jgi:hypothetical protein